MGPSCGDGVVQSSEGEACDDGVNDGSYNGCMPGCKKRGPYCGDGVTDKTHGEECDGGSGLFGASYHRGHIEHYYAFVEKNATTPLNSTI